MKGRKSFIAGVLIGFLICSMAFPIGIAPFVVSFIAFGTMFTFAVVSYLLLTIAGWPPASESTVDIYDVHKAIVGGSVTVGMMGFLSAAATKIASSFAVSMSWGFAIATLSLIVYIGVCFGFVSYLKR